MAVGLLDLAHANTNLQGAALRHLQRLVASWQPLADLCFADLIALAPVEGEEGHRFVVLAHVRPVTGQPLFPVDPAATRGQEWERPLFPRASPKPEIAGGGPRGPGCRDGARPTR